MKILFLSATMIMILSGSLLPALALGASQPCDTSILPPRWPSSHIYVTDANENLPYIPLTDHTAIFHDDDVWNTGSEPRTVHVTLTIRDQYTGQQFFNQTQSLAMQACSGPESVKWRFVPTQVTNYIATVSDDRGDVGMIFNSMLDATKSQTAALPLEQLRFGVDSHDVICRQDLQLVIKSEDNSPACVKPLTYNRLALQGWAKLLGSTTTTYVTVNGTTYDIPYTIRGYGNKMLYIESDSPTKYLLAHVESTAEKGELTLSIPKTLLDPQKYGQSEFTVLVDGIETKYTETATGNDTRTLTIPFGFGVKEIEVLAIGIGMQTSSEKNGTLSGTVSASVYGGPLGSLQNQSTHYEVDVYASDGVTIAGKTFSDANAKYSLPLPAGSYIIYTYNGTKQTNTVSVYPEKNTVFDISSRLVVP